MKRIDMNRIGQLTLRISRITDSYKLAMKSQNSVVGIR